MTKIKIFDVDARLVGPDGLEDEVNEWIRNSSGGTFRIVRVSIGGYTTHIAMTDLTKPEKIIYEDHLVCTVLYED